MRQRPITCAVIRDGIRGAADAGPATAGIFRDAPGEELRHKARLAGGQRIVTPRHALNGPGLIGPQDGIEPMRRMRESIVSETPFPAAARFRAFTEGEAALVA